MAKKLILWLLLLFALTNVVFASGNVFDQILEPVHGFNIEELYTEHGHFIDFIIYLSIFVAIVKLALRKRFENRQGNILAGVLGITLALSLAITERRLGFSIRSFGPIAAFIIVIFVAFIFFKAIFYISGGRIGSGSFSFVIIYFLTRAVSPALFNWLQDRAPSIHWVLGLAVIISICHAFFTFIHWRHPSLGNIKGYLAGPISTAKKGVLKTQELISEKRIIKGKLEKITQRERRQSKEIIAALKDIINIIDEHGNTSYGSKLISQKLQDIAPIEQDLVNKLAYLKNLDEWLKRFDLTQFKELREKYAAASEKGKEFIKKEILEQREKINIEKKIENLNLEVSNYEKDFRHYMDMAVNYLRAGRLEQAKQWLYKAIEAEKGTAGLLKKMKHLEDLLLSLTKIEVKLEAKG